jgi:two-component system OmpR family response regulator/two-component system response regulator QseB
MEELAARLRALIRRSHGRSSEVLTANGITLDPGARRVTFRGREVELNSREFELLRELMLSQGRVLTREQIESRLYEWGESLESNAIEVFVHHLRRKLAPDVIRTIRGVGYLLPADAGGG